MTSAGGWQEVGERVFRRRYAALDLNVGAVLGDGEVLVIDTRSWLAEAEELLADLRALTPLPCRQVLNTHAHFDHCFGNAAFRPAAFWGHERCAENLRRHGEEQRRNVIGWFPEAAADLAALQLVSPDRLVAERATVDVGGRRVELLHLGRGHTDNDLVAIVPDARVTFAGDLVEEGAPPAFGDAWPLEWPATLDRLLRQATPVVVPGHGDVAGTELVRDQAAEQHAVADLCRRVLAGELPVEEALARGPYPAETVRVALDRARATTGPIDSTAPRQ
ncbi:MAG TPA: MBL fold metallo-hydrolase [Actinomycetota bacterium]|jgi:glyoxylase-like metal-dependent hydrolase (beta-lactamase superfamily II)|nr:MBL fold metallo-hydrolase [Actinomycetota bacterium]